MEARLALYSGYSFKPVVVSARPVKRAEQVVRPLLFQQIEHVADKTVNRGDRLPRRTGHLGNGVEHLVDERVGIDHVDRPIGEVRRRRSRPFGRAERRETQRSSKRLLIPLGQTAGLLVQLLLETGQGPLSVRLGHGLSIRGTRGKVGWRETILYRRSDETSCGAVHIVPDWSLAGRPKARFPALPTAKS